MATVKNLSIAMTVGFAVASCAVDELGDAFDGGGPGDGGEEVTENPEELVIADPVYPTAHPRIYVTANRARLAAALSAGTPAASRFRSKVDAWLGGADIWGFQAWNGALLGVLTGDARYCTKAVATVEAQVVAAEAAIAAGGVPAVASDSYLEIGDLIGDLALVYDWCFSRVSASQRSRWISYANQAVWNVWHHTQARWGSRTIPWTGWSVDNPSNNYYYSFLRATMLLGLATRGENPSADGWLDQFRTVKLLGQLVPTFNADLVGGASREGTGYGVAMRRLFELYDWWFATTGENIGRRTNHTRASLLAFIHQVAPAFDRVAPTGDQSRDSTAALFDYHRHYLQELITLMPTDTVSGRAKTLLAASSVPAMTSSFMVAYDFLNDNAITPRALGPLNTAYHARGIGQLYMRSDWTTGATWVNLTAGPYTESHAHQDQGSLMVFRGGWLAHDPVVHSRSGLDQRTTAHGLVRIDSGGAPVRQIANTTSTLQALHQGTGYVHASADLTPAYNGHAAVQLVHREVVYLPPGVIVVFDRVRSSAGTTQTWQLAAPVRPTVSGARATIANAGHRLDVTRISGGGAMSVFDFAGDPDYTGGHRLDERIAGGDNRYLHVLSVDGAVGSAAAAGTASQPGVAITLAGGGSAAVSFKRDSVGATVTVGGVTSVLGAGVDALPN